MIKVVVLDFDDTISLTEEICFKLENEIAVSMGFPPMTKATHLKNWGVPVGEAILERIPGIDAGEFMKRLELKVTKHSNKGNLDVIPRENLEALEKLKKAGRKLAILTSRSFAEVKHLLHENHPLNDKIEKFYHRDNSEFLKPDPRVFDQIFDYFKINPQESVYVGDAVSDAIAAKGADMHFIAVLESGIRKKEDFKNVNVDLFAQKFIDIVPYVLSSP